MTALANSLGDEPWVTARRRTARVMDQTDSDGQFGVSSHIPPHASPTHDLASTTPTCSNGTPASRSASRPPSDCLVGGCAHATRGASLRAALSPRLPTSTRRRLRRSCRAPLVPWGDGHTSPAWWPPSQGGFQVSLERTATRPRDLSRLSVLFRHLDHSTTATTTSRRADAPRHVPRRSPGPRRRCVALSGRWPLAQADVQPVLDGPAFLPRRSPGGGAYLASPMPPPHRSAAAQFDVVRLVNPTPRPGSSRCR